MAATTRATNDAVTALNKTLQDILPRLVAPGAAPAAAKPETPAPAASNTQQPADAGLAALTVEVAQLKRDNAIKTAIADHGFTGEIRTAFEELIADAPAAQVASIAAKLAKLKPAASAAPAAVPAGGTPAAQPKVQPGASNGGPAAPAAAPIIPDRLRDIPAEVLRGMSMAEIREKYEAQKRAQGQGNPWAQARSQMAPKK
jgi:hypothetical protein